MCRSHFDHAQAVSSANADLEQVYYLGTKTLTGSTLALIFSILGVEAKLLNS